MRKHSDGGCVREAKGLFLTMSESFGPLSVEVDTELNCVDLRDLVLQTPDKLECLISINSRLELEKD